MRSSGCRRVSKSIALVLLLFGGVFSVSADPGLSAPIPIGSYLNGAFPDRTPGSSPNATWTTQNAFPNLTFLEPVRIVEHPTQNKLLVVSKDGQVNLIDDQPGANAKTLFLDLRGKVVTPSVGEGGLTGFVFHPEFGNPTSSNRGYVYVWYRWSLGTGWSNAYQRLSRFTVPDGSNSVDPNSELILIQQYDRDSDHTGGDMFFGPDGFLYIAVGDEGRCCDRALSTQRLDLGLFSGILRIDVDEDPARSHPIRRQPLDLAPPPSGWPNSFSQGYYIPNDNPFVDPLGTNLEEFYAIGLRHPWTVSRDSDTGNIWAADVGQTEREEVDLVYKGSNHQWAYKEGSTDGLFSQPNTIIGTEEPPIWEYDRSVGQAIIGAGVYRGALYPELFGKYLFSDFLGGQLWTLELASGGGSPQVTEIAQLPSGFPNGINSYLLTRDGRILMAKSAGGLDPGGTIVELVRQGGTVTVQPPDLLSQTGAFENLTTLSVTGGCIPYDMNVPFWSDAALKSRWMCIANDSTHDSPGEQIQFSENGDWQFPVGAVLIKHFEMDLSDVSPGNPRRLETRFIVHATDGYYGVTYKWLPGGSDAELLFDSLDEDLTIQTATGSRIETWHYPSRNECLRCHNNNASNVLGPNTRQLNKDLLYPSTGITSNQLSTLNSLNIFSPSINETDIQNFLKSTPTNDASAGLAARARSYLDSNCAYCHRPGGVRANFDARLTTPIDGQNLVYGELQQLFGIPGEAVIVPESLSQSVLHLRLNATSDQNGMPPLAKDFVDANGVAVVADWINSLGGFTVGNSITNASFIDAHHPGLFINESDTYTNNEGETVQLTIADFNFYAQKVGNPVTPLVVKVNGDNDFTVLAIGTTRTSSEYSQGSNTFPFEDFNERTIILQPGETIATGFMDSFPDGSGWGGGTVIPAINNSSEDEVWVLMPNPLILASDGFIAGRDTSTVNEGESPIVTNAGKALTQFTNLKRSYKFSIRFTYGFDGSGGTVPPPGGGSDETLGNAIVDGANLDSWNSNLLVNETDTYTNSSGVVEQVSVDRFAFYARRVADPVTPFVVRVNGNNNFTVLAIGTTRTGYSVGANDVAFSDGGAVLLSLNPGETLATGFLDANADGSGGGSGSVIPWDNGGDELWYTGGGSGSASGRVAVGLPPTPGASVYTTLNRDYHYQIQLTTNGGSGGNLAPVAVAGGPYSGIEGSAISFDGSGSYDPDSSNPLTYRWDFGDGSAPGSGAAPSHTYATAAIYTVSLIVNDGIEDSVASTATVDVSAVPPPGGGSDETLGNAIVDGANLDSWNSNLLVNETDTYTNSSGVVEQVSVDRFAFYARRVADPVTPFVVRVNGNNNFTVLAIGTTRTGYSVGANDVAFSDGGAVLLSLNPGETLATGFLDANADGSGGGSGSVIPWDNGGDELWYTGGGSGSASGRVAVGLPPTPGASVYTTLNRDYHYQIQLTTNGGSGGNLAPVAVAGGPYSGIEGSAISFDGSGSYDPDSSNPLTYRWDFGDGSAPGSGAAPSHTYATAAIYTVSLIVNDGIEDSVASTATVDVSAVPPPGGGSDETLGNAIVDGANLDSWNSNLLVNETDTYTNSSGVVEQVSVDRFAFYARRVADPVTPFVVRVNGNNNFTVLAIGTTRTGYSVGANDVAFSDGGAVLLSLNPGETLATGFLDANADGSGGGSGSVIPWDNGGDELWYTGGGSGSASGRVAVGLPPTPGASVYTTLNRDYHYQIQLTTNGGSGGNLAPVAVAGGPYSGIEGSAISFDGSGSYDPDSSNPLTYRWDFGDGSAPGSGAAPSHTYATAAIYTVSLIVNDGIEDSVASTATVDVSAVPPPGGGSDETLGNAIVDGANLDSWNSNLLVNETDTYTNSSGVVEQVSVDRFAFYARRVADPVTPFVVRVNGNNNFTVLAIGTTRTGYSVGANDVAFSDGGAVLLSLNPGETLATGFLDANADGSGGGSGSVIPWDNGGDELWYTGGGSGSASGRVAVGLPPTPGASVYTTLNRDYHYQIRLTVDSAAFTGAISNGSFEQDSLGGSSRFITNTLTDWVVTTGDVELLGSSVYPPPAGEQSLDLNGSQPGSIQQVVVGLRPNSLHTLYLSYSDQSVRGGVPELVTADIYVNAAKMGDIRTTANAPNFITCNGYEFMSSSSGTATVDVVSTVAGQFGAVIDSVYIMPGGLPQPPESPTVVNGSFEVAIVGDPHLCGDQLPGWRVTQENVDVVGSDVWPAFAGTHSLDLSGHGPGGIAQTVTGLTPGESYTFSFAYARHLFWGAVPLTADVILNGAIVAQLNVTTANSPPNWLTMSIPVVAPANGKITLEFRSTAGETGGGVIVDDVKLSL